jgi:Tfp pilus assembly pilus retraction ATPase PilT
MPSATAADRRARAAKEAFMALQWDRLLETCYRRNASDILLSPGASPMIRMAESWRSLQVPPLDAATIQALASKQLGENPVGHEDGYSYADFRFRDMGRFRATAFGYPTTNVLLISRYPRDASGGDSQSQEAAV